MASASTPLAPPISPITPPPRNSPSKALRRDPSPLAPILYLTGFFVEPGDRAATGSDPPYGFRETMGYESVAEAEYQRAVQEARLVDAAKHTKKVHKKDDVSDKGKGKGKGKGKERKIEMVERFVPAHLSNIQVDASSSSSSSTPRPEARNRRSASSLLPAFFQPTAKEEVQPEIEGGEGDKDCETDDEEEEELEVEGEVEGEAEGQRPTTTEIQVITPVVSSTNDDSTTITLPVAATASVAKTQDEQEVYGSSGLLRDIGTVEREHARLRRDYKMKRKGKLGRAFAGLFSSR